MAGIGFLTEALIQPLGLLLLLAGGAGSRRLRAAGWAACAAFSLGQAAIRAAIADPRGASTFAVYLVICCAMVAQELVAGAESRASQLYVARVLGAAGLANFLLSHLTFANAALTYLVAAQSIVLPLIAGMEISLPRIETMGQSILFKTDYAPILPAGVFARVRVPVHPTDIAIVYECTGAREILMAFFAIWFTRRPRALRARAARVAALTLYLANIARNSLVILLYGGQRTSFETAHELLGNLVILAGIMVAGTAACLMIPEIADLLFDAAVGAGRAITRGAPLRGHAGGTSQGDARSPSGRGVAAGPRGGRRR